MKASGSLFGLAYGDALGAATEFLSVAEIEQRFGPGGPSDLEGQPAKVTDDTQMTLAVARALADVVPWPEPVEAALRQHFVDWWQDPENNRAPGLTCLEACERLATGLAWTEASRRRSKGCGANMRVAPVGLVHGWEDRTRAVVAQFQSALTHGHPTALAASELTAFAVHWLRSGMHPRDLPTALRTRAHEQRTTYHGDWLADLWTGPAATTPEDFIARGWDECLRVLDNLDTALAHPDPAEDPCRATGEGWVAEEALGTALHCFLLFPDDPVRVLRRAATTSGDSDSIACLAGAFAGAYHGFEAWPEDWSHRIEYGTELAHFGRLWD
ncbi:ADP-ribosylglycohydrolase family protein [Saccharothrix variisporea]|uniref:ADP-ribosylglycohydrolase n=1 Tax=Saccharothrix variisporea TaxID=543527 RepID=A0A495X730_9PSEU|nr:ADP-ribosylglycohydrolase family protein [Saccharothrix variisporea]RKT69792.1 ADP-ribosylglycohydrolase [Saccharothrix variisporea]